MPDSQSILDQISATVAKLKSEIPPVPIAIAFSTKGYAEYTKYIQQNQTKKSPYAMFSNFDVKTYVLPKLPDKCRAYYDQQALLSDMEKYK